MCVACADPESFVRWGQILISFFKFDEGGRIQISLLALNATIEISLLTLNAGLIT